MGVCEMLVERIEEIDAEVGGMLTGWRSVEEGGRSLQEACQRLLEERVSPLLLCVACEVMWRVDALVV